jgi:hypothetical protein
MSEAEAKTRQHGLQQAASVIFALVAVVPLLIFAWTLHALGAIRSTQAQVSLGLALAVALLGFWMFRSLLGRMAEVVQALAAAVEQASRVRRPPTPAASPASAPSASAPTAPMAPAASPVVAPAAAPLPRAEPPATPSVVFRPPATAPAVAAVTARAAEPANGDRPVRAVAGLGAIRELSEVVRTMDALWYREATAHIGQRVQISVANSREPLVGTLCEATPDGLILEGPEGTVPIGYARVTAIDRLAS